MYYEHQRHSSGQICWTPSVLAVSTLYLNSNRCALFLSPPTRENEVTSKRPRPTLVHLEDLYQ